MEKKATKEPTVCVLYKNKEASKEEVGHVLGLGAYPIFREALNKPRVKSDAQ